MHKYISRTFRPEHCDPLFVLRALGVGRSHCALLESGQRLGSNDFSFVALGARDIRDSLDALEEFVERGACERQSDDEAAGARLSMGYIGFISYEAARLFESIDLTPSPDVPDCQFVMPEVLLKIDHGNREVTLVTHADTKEDLAAIERVIHSSPFFDDAKESISTVRPPLPLPTLEEIEPMRQRSRAEHCANVERAKEAIAAGEAFQVVLSQELLLEADVPPDSVYEQLRALNPSPYMYYFQTPERTIVGASPETLVRVEGDAILYRPIAGTRKRTGDAEHDDRMREELLHDEKERCEHQMLVDLGRNDVGRVAEIGSVQVCSPFHIEQYAHVFHIVSTIEAKKRADCSPLDAVRSVFPAGTLSGAPKLRAMEIIRDLEQSPRGIYGGAFGYVDHTGNLDFAIMIRTMLFQNGKISIRAGGGIVLDSVPELEDNECLHKARSCLAAVQLARHSAAAS